MLSLDFRKHIPQSSMLKQAASAEGNMLPIHSKLDRDGFTIVMNTFRRDTALAALIPHYLSCKPREFHLDWNDVGRNVPPFLKELQNKSTVTFVIHRYQENLLTNRFNPDRISTSAVFSVDDDVRIPCDELHSAYTIWLDNPLRLVGFAPRFLHRNGYTWDESYQNWGWNKANTIFV